MNGDIRGMCAVAVVALVLTVLVSMIDQGCGGAHASPWTQSQATQYGSKTFGDPLVRGTTYDKQAGDVFACTPRGRIERMDPLRWGVAHRSLPCGTVVEICKGRFCVVAPVVDRGPYHATPENCPGRLQRCWARGRTMIRLVPGWRYANDLDLLPRVAFAIRLGGKGLVRWRVLSK